MNYIILFATGTISLNANSTNNNESTSNQQTSNNDNTIDNNNTNNNDYDAESIAKEKMPIAISFFNQKKLGYIYCGNFDYDDTITVDTDIEYVKILMDASSKFKTLDELKKHLENNMSDDLIDEYFNTDEKSYLEKDGKLYCKSVHKGFEWISVMSEDKINEASRPTTRPRSSTTAPN